MALVQGLFSRHETTDRIQVGIRPWPFDCNLRMKQKTKSRILKNGVIGACVACGQATHLGAVCLRDKSVSLLTDSEQYKWYEYDPHGTRVPVTSRFRVLCGHPTPSYACEASCCQFCHLMYLSVNFHSVRQAFLQRDEPKQTRRIWMRPPEHTAFRECFSTPDWWEVVLTSNISWGPSNGSGRWEKILNNPNVCPPAIVNTTAYVLAVHYDRTLSWEE